MMTALDRLGESFDQLRDRFPQMTTGQLLELAIADTHLVLVDMMAGTEDDTDLERALRGFLYYTRPHSGPYGQSMENTLAIEADHRLRRAAARHLDMRE